MIASAQAPFWGSAKSVSGSLHRCRQLLSTAAGKPGGWLRSWMRRGAVLPMAMASKEARKPCSSWRHSELSTSILKAWRRKFSGPVFSSRRRIK